MKKFIPFLFCLIILCSWCKRIIHDDYYKRDDRVFDATLQSYAPEYEILCSMCYRQIEWIFQKYYEKEELDNDEND